MKIVLKKEIFYFYFYRLSNSCENKFTQRFVSSLQNNNDQGDDRLVKEFP